MGGAGAAAGGRCMLVLAGVRMVWVLVMVVRGWGHAGL